MKIPQGAVLPNLFMGNFFCLIPNTDLAFVVVSRNSCSFLKKVAVYNKTHEWLKSVAAAHKTIGYDAGSEFLIPVNEMDDYEKEHGRLVKFAVWRDPVERFISNYKYFCVEAEYRTYFHYLNLHADSTFNRFLEFAVFELGKADPLLQDEHIRKQSDYYQPEKLDHIVPIDRLNSFLTEMKVPFKMEQVNKTNTHFRIESEEQREMISNLYSKDFVIKVNY